MNIFVTVQMDLAETSSHSIWDEIRKVGGVFLEGKMTPGDKEAQVFPHIERIWANHHATMLMNARGDGRQPQG